MTAFLASRQEIGERRAQAILQRCAPTLESVIALSIAFSITGMILALAGHDPLDVYRELVSRVLFRGNAAQDVIVRAVPLLIAALAVFVAVRAGLWNIGIDGQVLVGAIVAAWLAGLVHGESRFLLWAACLVAGAVAGLGWIAIPAWLRGRLGINEIVTTIMFNYVALSLTAWLVRGPLRDDSLVAPQTPAIPRELRFATIGDSRVHVGLILALVLWVLVAVWSSRTVSGFEARIIGDNPRAARHALIPVSGIVVAILLASGALAGIAGSNDVLSTKGTFQAEWNPEHGLSAFALVFLARRNAWALLPAAWFFGILSYGADVLPRAAGVAPSFFTLFEGILLITFAVLHWRPWTRFMRRAL